MLVRGENVAVMEYDSVLMDWVLYGCARSCSLSLTTEFIETSTTTGGKFATYKPTKHTIAGSLQGLVNLDGSSLLSLEDLREKQIAQDLLQIRFVRTGVDGTTTYTDEFYAYIADTSDEGAIDGMNSFTVELKGTGALTQS